MSEEIKSINNTNEVAYIINAHITAYLWSKWDGTPDDDVFQRDRLQDLNSISSVCRLLGFPIRVLWDPDNGLPFGCEINGNEIKIFGKARLEWEKAHGIERKPDPEPDLGAVWTPLDEDDE